MKTYSPKEMAKLLNIQPSTLRRYSSVLEEHAYKIARNDQNHRSYKEADVKVFQQIIKGTETHLTLGEAINETLHTDVDKKHAGNMAAHINHNDTEKVKEILHQQTELIKHLIARLDKQEKYMMERDQLLATFMNHTGEKKQQITPNKKRKRLLSRIFKR